MIARAKTLGFPGFLVISALLIIATVIVSGLLVGTFVENLMLAHEGQGIVDLVQIQAVQHLIVAAFQSPGEQASVAMFQTFFDGLPGIFRVKAYDANGTIVWSDDATLIGRRFGDNPELRTALGGRMVKDIGHPTAVEHSPEMWTPYFADVYVPIKFPGSPRIVGVIEAHKDMAHPMAGLHGMQRRIWTLTGGLGLFLYVALALVVRRASANERRAIERLEDQNRELMLLHGRLEATLAGIADRMVIVDREHRIVWMNAVATQACRGGEETLGGTCFEVLAGAREPCANCPAARTFVSGHVEHGVGTAPSPCGRVRYWDLVTAPLPNASGEVSQVLEVARDITEIVEMEDQLKATNQTLRETQAELVEKERLAAVGQVVVSLHHAILNPLTGVLGALMVLRSDANAADKARALGEAEAEIRKIERLIRQLAGLREAKGVRYVGNTTMLDLDRAV